MLCRHFRLSPRATRFFVMALALLQFVAPTWHICALGGHTAKRGAAHHRAKPALPANQPLICFCPAPQKPLDLNTPRLNGVSHDDHATCLALLLQIMPGQTGALVEIFDSRSIGGVMFDADFQSAPPLAAPRRFLGRAPPQKC